VSIVESIELTNDEYRNKPRETKQLNSSK